jgi:hypothetical protein
VRKGRLKPGVFPRFSAAIIVLIIPGGAVVKAEVLSHEHDGILVLKRCDQPLVRVEEVLSVILEGAA